MKMKNEYKKKNLIKNIEARFLPMTVIFMVVVSGFVGMFVVMNNDSIVRAVETSDFIYNKKITIDNSKIEEDLRDFPVWVYNTSTDYVGNILANASDIAFFDSTNSTQFNHEIEVWNGTTGELGVWVNVTSISSSADTVFYMYYGDSDTEEQPNHNPTAVWDSNFTAVWHMNGTVPDSGGGLVDSSGGGWILENCTTEEASPYLGVPTEGVGIAGYGQYFNLSDIANKSFWSNESTGKGSSFTMESFVNPDGVPGSNARIVCKKTEAGGSEDRFYMNVYAGNSTLQNRVKDAGVYRDSYGPTSGVTPGSWHYVGLVYDANDHNYAIQNTTRIQGDVAGAGVADGDKSSFCVGPVDDEDHDYSYTFNGTIDEIRVSNIARNSSWTNATYHSVMTPESFLTFGEFDSDASSYNIVGIVDDRITFSGTAGLTVFCNSSGDYNEYLEINMSINDTDNVTEIRVFMDDLNSSSNWINASNITLYVSNSSNMTYYSFGSFSDGGSNISINESTWDTYVGVDNPFESPYLTDIDTSIFLVFKLSIPSEAVTDVYWSSALDSYKIYVGYI